MSASSSSGSAEENADEKIIINFIAQSAHGLNVETVMAKYLGLPALNVPNFKIIWKNLG